MSKEQDIKEQVGKVIPRICADNKPACKYYEYSKCEKYDEIECRYQVEIASRIHALYLPLLEQAKQDGRTDVVEWIQENYLVPNPVSRAEKELWHAKLKEWAIVQSKRGE